MSYAISFDLDTEQLKQAYPNPSWQNAYGDIKKTLTPLGFDWQQGSVYFGTDVNAVQCVLAAQKLSQAGESNPSRARDKSTKLMKNKEKRERTRHEELV